MSGLEALSLVCSIMQVISFTKELATTCKDIFDGRATIDDITQENTASIKSLLDGMDKCSDAVQQRTQNEKDLREIARKCSSAAQELQTEIQLITKYHKPGSAVKAFSGGIKFFTHKSKVKKLSEKFQKYQKTLETHLLVRVCTKTDALQIQQQSRFIELSDTMQHFISQIAAGHTEMATLIDRDGTQTRQQIQQSEMRVRNSINAAHVEADMEAKRNRLLQSLKFESMNSRRTDIKIANKATYVSFFKSLEFDEAPTSGSAAEAWAEFVDWLQSSEQAFWIQGKPGAGKSTLVKFLLQHKDTHKALAKWGNTPLIVSHFFWKPGNKLQRNFKGLLCSLSHQLLSDEPSLIDLILSKFRYTKENDSIGDWEIPQLVAVFQFILSHFKSTIFLLIDGVDEAVDTEEILKFLGDNITLRNTKWCISSRGEKVFQQAFSKYKGFKLNEFTRDDMLHFAWEQIQYALGGIQEYEDMYAEDFLRELQDTLVDKAEGVYLWLVLALESIKRGFRHNDSKDVILSRLRNLSNGLEELYADMWDRLGEDKHIYQIEAARYFSLLMMNRTIVDEYNEMYDGLFPSEWPLTSFQMMLAHDDELQRKLLNESYELQLSNLNKKCSDMTKIISIRTAGLIVIQQEKENLWPKLRVREEYPQLQTHVTSKIEFLHRTLFDFLRDTKHGKNILSRAQTDSIRVRLATTMLCQLRIMKTRNVDTYHNNPVLHSQGGLLHYFRWLLNQAKRDDSERLLDTLLPAYETLFEASLIPWDQRSNKCPRPCFDILLLGDPAFHPIIRQRLKSKGPSYATCVLREYMFVENARFCRPHDLSVDILEFLLDLGADINSADACLFQPPVNVAHFTGCFTYGSALSEFVTALYENRAHISGFYEPLKLLVAFLESSPDLDTRTSCVLRSDWYRENGDWNLRVLLSALPEDKNKDNYNPKHEIDDQVATIITEVNLKFLIENFLKNLSSNHTATNDLSVRALQLAQQDGSKPYVKARFIVLMQHTRHPHSSQASSVSCYQFLNQDVDVFSELLPTGFTIHSLSEFHPSFRINAKLADRFIGGCEKVDVSALFLLLDQKLGACLRESQ